MLSKIQFFVTLVGVIPTLLHFAAAAGDFIVQDEAQYPIQPALQPSACNFKNYVSLGDSYSAGLHAYPEGRLPGCRKRGTDLEAYSSVTNCTTLSCSLNYGSYAWRFYEKQRMPDFRFLACSGATTDSCQSSQVPKAGGADLVTITIGVNDGRPLHRIVVACVYDYQERLCDDMLATAEKALVQTPAKLDVLFSAIKAQQSPSTKVVVLGYVKFWPDHCVSENCEGGICATCTCQHAVLSKASMSQRRRFNKLISGVNQALKNAATKARIMFIDIDPSFGGHRMCDSQEPYFYWDPKPGRIFYTTRFHPTQEGHGIYLEQLNKASGCE